MEDPYGSADAVLDILNLNWEGPTKAIVQGNQYKVYTAPAKNTFWAAWKKHKWLLKDYGVNVEEEDGGFIVCVSINVNQAKTMEMQKNSSNVQPGPYNIHPDALAILLEHQVPAAGTMEKILQIEDFVLDASEMGLGKTFHALATVKTFGWNFGVICPASAVSKWEETAWEWFGMEPEFVLSYQKLVRGNTHYLTKTVIPGRGRKKDDRSWKWNTIDDVFLIFDEIQHCSGDKSQNSEMLESALRNRHIKTIGCSATVADSPLNLKVLGRALGLHKGYDWWTWCQENGCKPGYFGGLEFVKNKEKQRYYQIRLHNQIYPKKAARLLKRDLKEQLPDNILLAECIDVDFNPKQGYLKEALKHLDLIEEADWEKENHSPLTERTRNRQRAELVKIPFLIEDAVEAMGQGMSVIIFTNFKMSIEILEGQLKSYKPALIVGGQTRAVRDQNLSTFQNNKTQLMLSNIDAGSESVDMHDTDGRYPRYSLLCPMDKPKKMIQCMGRPDRVGKKSPSTQKLVFARNSQEEEVFKNVTRKMENIHLLNDGVLEEALSFKLQN